MKKIHAYPKLGCLDPYNSREKCIVINSVQITPAKTVLSPNTETFSLLL